jgi:predicted amino acid racemase
MSWPKLVINETKIRQNVRNVVRLCKGCGIQVIGVTKGLCAHPAVAEIMISEGCAGLADSRMKNLIYLRTSFPDIPLMLLRIPMPSEIPSVIRYTDCALVSMPETIFRMESYCVSLNCNYKIIIMCDLGDLREGILSGHIPAISEAVNNSPHVECVGVGVNFGCFGGVLPSPEKLNDLLSIGRRLEQETCSKFSVFSGGATSSLSLVESGEMPLGINQLRIGEGILLGTDVTGMRYIPYLNRDVMYLETEIVEIYRKPSVPFGTIGADAFGNVPVFQDRGVRLRAIAAIGRQDLGTLGLYPLVSGIEVLGASSDHLILDIEESGIEYKIGDIISFSVDYGAMLALSTSPYVEIEMTQ